MRLARSVLQNLEGVNIFGIIGFIIFFAFFIFVLTYVIRMKKNKVDEYSKLPLSRDEDDPESETENHKT
jgi:cbb3-type cytochrome oxidase subunit 3